MSLRFEKINGKSRDIKKVRRLFISAFPKDERPPFYCMLKGSRKPGNDFLAMYDGDEFIGFTYVISKSDLAYVFFLAIEDSKRGMGYGSEALTLLNSYYEGHRIFLAIEQMDANADNYPERVRRLAFYEKNGLHLLGIKLREGSVIYDSMGNSLCQTLTDGEYRELLYMFLGPVARKRIKVGVVE